MPTFETIKQRCKECLVPRSAGESPPEYIFIGGAARTGTTLLQSILCSDQSTNPLIPEASLLRFIIEAYERSLLQVEKFPGTYFDGESDLQDFYSQVAIEFCEKIRNRHSCKTLVLKEPALSPFFPLVNNILKGKARFICLVRDPRDAISSMLKWGKRIQDGNKPHIFQNRDMQRLSSVFMDYYALFNYEDESFFEKMFIIRYEDLVTNPAKSLDHIREFTAIKMDDYSAEDSWKDGLLDYKRPDSPVKEAVSKLFGGPIAKSSIGSHSTNLTENENSLVSAYCDYFFDIFDYNSIKPENDADVKPIEFREKPAFIEFSDEIARLPELRYKAAEFDRIVDDLPRLRFRDARFEELREEVVQLRVAAQKKGIFKKR